MPQGLSDAARPFVEIDRLTKAFAGSPVLEEISLAAAPGAIISLIGPSGCGKTTLLRIMAGLTEPTSGRILVDGTLAASAHSGISYVFQEPTLLPWLDVRRNIELPMKLRGISGSERRRRAEPLLEMVKLTGAAGKFPRQLSGGMQMRAAFARALSVAPRLMLLDEPFGAVDALTRNQLNEDFLRIQSEQGWTAFFVTHAVSEAVFLSSRICVFSKQPGRIAEIIELPFPYPRRASLREDPLYLEAIRKTTRALREASEPQNPGADAN